MKLVTLRSVFMPTLFFAILQLNAAGPLHPGKLRCMNRENPLGIDSDHPSLGWILLSESRNQLQSAYEIVVSDNVNSIVRHEGNMWSSGKRTGAEHTHIQYGGKALQSFHRYYWSVRVYNQDGRVSDWSAPSWFETAMLAAGDWQAKWIGDGSSSPARDEDYYLPDRMPLFRKTFRASGRLLSARLYISGLGYYEAYLNGRRVGDQVLDPGFTTYRKEVLYSVYDITALINRDNNVAAVQLGNGWWNPLPFRLFGRWDLRDYQQTGRPCLKAEIHLNYSNGKSVVVPSDASWFTAPGAITRNNVYLGEYEDARLESPGWNSMTTNLAGWKAAVPVEGPSGALRVQMQPPVRITKHVRPVRIYESGKDTFIVDMGQNFAGVASIRVDGPAGQTVALRYGEDVFPDGRIDIMTTAATQIKKGGIRGGPGAPETAWQEDRYTLRGGGPETWHPHFTFHGFRYLEITGWPGTPSLDDIEGLRMNADLQVDGTFSCSNEMFNRLHKAIQWTFLSNVFSIQSDCPGREKMGYGGDMVVTADAFIYNYDMENFYRKAIMDFANEQRPEGGITEIAPFTGIADRGYGDLSGPLGWELAFCFLQKQLYDFYADSSVIAEHYDQFIRQVEWLRTRSRENLFDWDISDHQALDPKPEAFSASVFYYHHVLLASEFAGLLGRHDDSLKYAVLAGRIKRAIQNKYYVPGTGRFDNATQAAQIFALWYDLSPEKEKTLKFLLSEFVRHNNHLSTGIFSTKMMFEVLRENNLNDIAYTLVNQRDFPGWGFMLANGATTLWESWAYPHTVHSQNHPMFGSVDEWFFRSLLGINSAAPGFADIIIKPQPAGDLQWARGSYNSIQGLIGSDWKIENGNIYLNVIIPAGCRAKVFIPTSDPSTLKESGHPAQGSPAEAGYVQVSLGSGNYSFSAAYDAGMR